MSIFRSIASAIFGKGKTPLRLNEQTSAKTASWSHQCHNRS